MYQSTIKNDEADILGLPDNPLVILNLKTHEIYPYIARNDVGVAPAHPPMPKLVLSRENPLSPLENDRSLPFPPSSPFYPGISSKLARRAWGYTCRH